MLGIETFHRYSLALFLLSVILFPAYTSVSANASISYETNVSRELQRIEIGWAEGDGNWEN